MADPVVVITGTVVNGASVPIAGAVVRMRTVSPTLTTTGNGVTTQDIETLTAVDGTWAITQIAGLAGQVDIPVLGLAKDYQLPSVAGTYPFTSLTLFNRGTLTPATILSNFGPSMGGDLLGQSPQPQVIGLRGVQLAVGSPTNGQGYIYDSGQQKFVLAPLTPGSVVVNIAAGTAINITGTPVAPIINVAAGAITSTQLDATTNSTLSGALQRAGGTMTGALTLAGNSTGSLQATTQQEVLAGLAAKLDVGASIPESQVTNLVTDLGLRELTANKGAANGYAPLVSGQIPLAFLPATFTPAAHAATHATAGSDPVSPVSIGAADLVHTHAQSQVIGLVSDLASKGGLTLANTWTTLQTFAGGIVVPGGFSPDGPFTVGATYPMQIQMAAPGVPTLTPSATGGTLASNTYFYVITSLDGAGGETVRGVEASTPVTGPNGSVLINWTAIPGAASYRVYRGLSAGNENVYYTATTNSLTDTGSAATNGTPPVSSSAYVVKISPSAASWFDGGNVGVGTSTPSSKLQVVGTATATAFAGPLTGNVTGDVLGNLTGNVLGNVTGNVTGTAANITGILATTNGGLGLNAGASTGFPKFTAGSVGIAALAAGDIPSLDTAKITTGIFPLARGGTGADLTATGGTSHVVRQNSTGAALTVSQLAYSEITGTPSTLPPSGAASGDLGGTYPSPDVVRINGSTVPAGGGLTTGNVLQVTGAAALGYAALNLAGGAGFVTGALPAANVGSLPASQITSGQLALARGGTGADMSATGGSGFFVRQNSTGGAFSSSAIASGDLPATITSNTSGNAATATTAVSFSGALVGDVTGVQGATVVSLVGAQTAANVAAGSVLANAATSANTASAIVRRDASGNFVAGTITAALVGNATTATDGLTSASGSGALSLNLAAKALTGSVANYVGATISVPGVAGLVPPAVAGDQAKVLAGDGTWVANGAGSVSSVALTLPASTFSVAGSPITSSGTLAGSFVTQTANLVLAGPASGGAATPAWRTLVSADIPATIAANTTGSAASFTGSLAGDVTGTQAATVVAFVGGKTAAQVAAAVDASAGTATALATPNTLALRDGSAGTAFAVVTGTGFYGTGAGAGVDVLRAYGPGTPAIHLRDTTAVTGAGLRLAQSGSSTLFRTYNSADSLTGTPLTLTSTSLTGAFWDKGGAVFNVLSYGADPTGAADSTTAINAAIAAAAPGGGGTIFFPDGTYQFTSLTISNVGIKLVGAGTSATVLVTTTLASAAITISALNVAVRDMTITTTGTTTTGHSLISASGGATYLSLQRLSLSNFQTGISVLAADYVVIEDVFLDPSPSTTFSALIRIKDGVSPITLRAIRSSYSATGTGIELNANSVIVEAFMHDVVIASLTSGASLSCIGGATLIAKIATSSFLSPTAALSQVNGNGGNTYDAVDFLGPVTVASGFAQFVGCRFSSTFTHTANSAFATNVVGAEAPAAALVLGATSANFKALGGRFASVTITPGASAFYFKGTAGAGGVIGPTITAATTISPTCQVHVVTGTAAIDTINQPGFNDSITLIPDIGSTWTFTTSGNIARSLSAIEDIPITLTFNDVTRLWYPQAGNPLINFTPGALPFGTTGGGLDQDASNLFWNNTTKRLGIGTNSPGNSFHIYAAAANDAFAGVGTDVTAGPALTFGYGGASFGRGAGFFNSRPDGSAAAPNPSLRFLVANTERMLIDNLGNVGIGFPLSTVPGAKLDVNGLVRATSDQIRASSNGATWTSGSTTELVTLNTGAAFTDTTADLPANSIIDAVVARITTTITTAANWSLGVSGTTTRFSAASSTLTAGTTVVGLQHWQGSVTTDAAGPVQTAAAKVRITLNANPGAGAIRLTWFYRTATAPTS